MNMLFWRQFTFKLNEFEPVPDNPEKNIESYPNEQILSRKILDLNEVCSSDELENLTSQEYHDLNLTELRYYSFQPFR